MNDDKTYTVRLTEAEMQTIINTMTFFSNTMTRDKKSISQETAMRFLALADKLKKAERTVVLLGDA
jgi:hypothetical protein